MEIEFRTLSLSHSFLHTIPFPLVVHAISARLSSLTHRRVWSCDVCDAHEHEAMLHNALEERSHIGAAAIAHSNPNEQHSVGRANTTPGSAIFFVFVLYFYRTLTHRLSIVRAVHVVRIDHGENASDQNKYAPNNSWHGRRARRTRTNAHRLYRDEPKITAK